MNQHSINYGGGQENKAISLQEILQFLKGASKILLLSSVFGLSASLGYILLTPNQYEALVQIKMAQISISNPTNPFGITVEDPNSLIARMQLPTNYSSEIIAACGYQDNPRAALSLSREVKLSIPKGLSNTVELKVLSPSPQVAKTCAQALFDQIRVLQAQFAKPFVEEARVKLAQDNERIDEVRRLIIKADRSGSAMSAAYLAARDELTYFLTDREKMLDLINSVDKRGTQLISPIYVPEKPVSPKKLIALFAGLLAGLFLGLGVALLQRLWLGASAKKNAGSTDT